MKLKNAVVLALTFLLLATSAMAEPSDAGKKLLARTFAFKHKEADKAAAIIKPLMSAEGTINLQPSTNSFVVTDRPENMKSISSAIAQYDVAPRQFRIVVRIVAASRVAAENVPKIDEELKEVAANLTALRFNAFEDLGERTIEAKEGETGRFQLETGYSANFQIGEYDPSSDSVKVSDFVLSKVQGSAQQTDVAPLLKTTLNLKLGRMVILGASKVPDSQRALMIVVVAQR